MRIPRFTVALTALSAVGCAASTPVGPSPVAVAPVTSAVASQLRAFSSPLELYAGGATQVHVGAFGFDGAGVLRPVSGLPMSFTSDGGKLTALSVTTGDDGFAVALLDVTRNDVGRQISITATTPTLSVTVQVFVAAQPVTTTPTPVVTPVVPTPTTPVAPVAPVAPVTPAK